MMSSRGQDAAGLRVPRRGKRSGGPMQYVMFAVVAAVVVIVVVVVMAAGRKPATTAGKTPKASKSAALEGGRSSQRKARSGEARSSSTERRARRDRARQERVRPTRRSARTEGVSRSGRSSSGSYSAKRSGPPVVKAIGTDPGGSHYALVGERYVRGGDEVEGRRILEVSGAGVKVQYATKTYTVGVNQPLY